MACHKTLLQRCRTMSCGRGEVCPRVWCSRPERDTGSTPHASRSTQIAWRCSWVSNSRMRSGNCASTTVEFLHRFRDLFEAWNMYISDERPIGVAADTLAVHARLTGSGLDRKLTACARWRRRPED